MNKLMLHKSGYSIKQMLDAGSNGLADIAHVDALRQGLRIIGMAQASPNALLIGYAEPNGETLIAYFDNVQGFDFIDYVSSDEVSDYINPNL